MTLEEKRMVDLTPTVDRMGVYEFLEKDGSCKKYCVIVSADHRKHDRFTSVVMLTDADSECGYADAIGVKLPIGDYYAHCGMVTYVRRDRLGRKVGKVGDKTRTKITKMIGVEMGVLNNPRDSVWEEDNKPDFEKLYNDLLATIAKRGGV